MFRSALLRLVVGVLAILIMTLVVAGAAPAGAAPGDPALGEHGSHESSAAPPASPAPAEAEHEVHVPAQPSKSVAGEDNGWVTGANIAAALSVLIFLALRGRRLRRGPVGVRPGNADVAGDAGAGNGSAGPVERPRLLDRVFRSRLYPVVPQAAVIGIFVYILFALIWGPRNPEDNLGSVFVWIMWWPVIPLTFVLLGRFWCVLCPWGALSDWLQSHFSLGLKVPRVIKEYGIWVIFGGFIFITWYELAFGLTASASATVTVLLVVAVLALVTSLLFERRVWCRYLCPLGGIFGNYAQTAVVEFRGTPEKCDACTNAFCFRGGEAAPGCPLLEFPKTMESNRLCNLCGNCVKNCENGSPTLRWRMPGRELWEKRDAKLDEAVLASVLVGVILMAGFGMLEFWQSWIDGLSASTGVPRWALITVAYVIAALGSLGLSLAASGISARSSGESTWANLTRYGYALIPLNLATHTSHNMFHLLGEGRNIGKVLLGLMSPGSAVASGGQVSAGAADAAGHLSAALISPAGIRYFQFALMGLGIAASLLVAWKIARNGSPARRFSWRGFAPQLSVIAIFSLASFLLFVLPMAARH